MFSLHITEVFEGRVAFKPPLRAIWADLRSCYPWEIPLPHSTTNKKNHILSFIFSLLSFLCSLPSALEAARGPSTRRHGQEKGWPLSGGFIWAHLAVPCGDEFIFSFVVLLLEVVTGGAFRDPHVGISSCAPISLVWCPRAPSAFSSAVASVAVAAASGRCRCCWLHCFSFSCVAALLFSCCCCPRCSSCFRWRRCF